MIRFPILNKPEQICKPPVGRTVFKPVTFRMTQALRRRPNQLTHNLAQTSKTPLTSGELMKRLGQVFKGNSSSLELATM